MFDSLTVEILHIIFDYLWTNEIFNSFLNINHYLNSVILSYNNSFLNFNSILRPIFNLTCRHIRPHQVISLTLSDSDDTPSQSQLFLSRFPLEQFCCLRALTLIAIDDSNQLLFASLDKMLRLTALEINSKYHCCYLNIMPQPTRISVSHEHITYFESHCILTSTQLPCLRHLS